MGRCAFVEDGQYGRDKATALDVVAGASGVVDTEITVEQSFEAVIGSATTPWGTVDRKVTACQAGLGGDKGEGGGRLISFS